MIVGEEDPDKFLWEGASGEVVVALAESEELE